jgi:hypothetical protein
MQINLNSLSHSALLKATRDLAQEERRITSLVLLHLEEIERRRLHLENHSSLFDFCRRELGYSEDQANARISAMRLSREVPEVIAKVESGELSLTNLVKAQSYFRQELKAGKTVTQADKKDLLSVLEGKSTRDCERIIAERLPEAALPAERERILSGQHTEITFVADNRLKEDLESLRALWGHHGYLSYAELFQRMASLVLKQVDPAEKRGAKNIKKQSEAIKSPGAPQAISNPSSPPAEFVTPEGRHISAETRREVWQRDQGRCTHRYAATQMRCGSKFALEVDHLLPFAYGGTHTLDNLTLLCRAHHSLKSAKAQSAKAQSATAKSATASAADTLSSNP